MARKALTQEEQETRAVFSAGFRAGWYSSSTGMYLQHALKKAKANHFGKSRRGGTRGLCRVCGEETTHTRARTHGLCFGCETQTEKEDRHA